MPVEIIPIPDTPALKFSTESESVLIIADLHLGVEHTFADAGVIIPKATWEIQERLINLIKSEKVDRLTILGDIKHTVPETSWQETQELPEFFRGLLTVVEKIDIVPGNHDTNLERLIPDEIVFHNASGWKSNSLGFAHGHSWPSEEIMKSEILVLAHNHPTVALIDELDVRHNYPCWVRGPVVEDKLKIKYGEDIPISLNEIVLIPSFYEFGSGTTVNEPDQKLLGPFLKNGCMNLLKSQVYLLDGTLLGTVERLMLS